MFLVNSNFSAAGGPNDTIDPQRRSHTLQSTVQEATATGQAASGPGNRAVSSLSICQLHHSQRQRLGGRELLQACTGICTLRCTLQLPSGSSQLGLRRALHCRPEQLQVCGEPDRTASALSFLTSVR